MVEEHGQAGGSEGREGLEPEVLAERIDRLDARMDAEVLGGIRQDIRRLDGRIEKLDDKIEAVDEKLTGKIEQLDQRLTGKIEAGDERLAGMFDKLDEKFDAKFDRLDEKFDAKFDRLQGLMVQGAIGIVVSLIAAMVGAAKLGLLGG